jgi:hypothetical protein
MSGRLLLGRRAGPLDQLAPTLDHNGRVPSAVVVEVLEPALAVRQRVHEFRSGPPSFRVATPDETRRLATATDTTQPEIAASAAQLDAIDPAQSYPNLVLQQDPVLAGGKMSEDGLQQRDTLRGCDQPQGGAVGTGPVLDRHIRLAHPRMLSDLRTAGSACVWSPYATSPLDQLRLGRWTSE